MSMFKLKDLRINQCKTSTFRDLACIKHNDSNIDENINSNVHLNNRILLNRGFH